MRKVVFLSLLTVVFATGAFAQPVSTANTDNVTATVIENCTVSEFALGFGTYDPTSATPDDDATAVLTVRCTAGVAATVDLDLGVNSAAGVRRMTDGTNFLAYGIFTDVARATAWTSANFNATVPAPTATYNLYGRIPALQSVPVGSYDDTVVASVNW